MATALPVVLTPPAATAAPTPTASAVTAPAIQTKVTLVTGDVVAYVRRPGGADSVQVVQRRPGIRYDVYNRADGWHVLPSDATQPVTSGRVDDTLFNVTYLATNGYQDSRDQSLPLIMDYPGGAVPARAAATRALPGSKVTRTLASVDAVAFTVPKRDTPKLWQTTISHPSAQQRQSTGDGRLLLDRKYHVDLAESVAQIQAPAAWAAGLDGTGVRVGVLDTGVDLTHPDLAGQVVESASFVPAEPDVVDRHGHGTHVASTIAGTGAASGGVEKGAAPGARLVIGKVLDHAGFGTTSDIIAGMEWAAGRAKVVSMSLGAPAPAGPDPLSDAVNTLTASTGTLFVIAAGNDGPDRATVGSPGRASAALTVGADDRNEQIAPFSSRGPADDGSVKPELVAPGVNIVAARATGTTMGTPVNDKYTTASGTSMATPHVAASAAILAQRHPDWTGAQLKAALIASTKDIGKPVNDQGAGQVDVKAAIAQTVTTSPATLGFGELEPGVPDQDTTVTYHNAGTAPVTLTLAARVADPTGKAAPEGTLDVPPSVTVPAGGAADIHVVLHPGKVGVGSQQGLITATAPDGGTVHTPLGFTNGAVKHTLSLSVLGFDGKTVIGQSTLWVLPVDRPSEGPKAYSLYNGITVTLPAGKYFLSLIHYTDADGPQMLETTGVIYKPEVDLYQDQSLVLDFSKTKRIAVHTDEPGLESAVAATGTRTTPDGTPWTFNVGVGSWEANLFVSPTEPVTTGKFDFQYTTTITRSQLDVTVGAVTVHPAYLAAYGGGYDYVAPKKLKMFDGRHRYDLVYVGAGTPEDFAAAGDLHGKVVLGQVDILAGEGTAFAARAVQAGAVGLLMFDRVRMTLRGDSDQNEVVPVGYLNHPDGLRLLSALRHDKGAATLVGKPTSPYAYHLAYTEAGKVPVTPSFTVRTRDLARFDTTYHANAETMYATAFERGDIPEPPLVESIRAPQTRTEYYGPITDSTPWVRYTNTFVSDQWEMLSGPAVPLRAGSRQTDDWYGSPMRYGQTEFFNLPTMPAPYLANREGNSLFVFPQLRDGAGHVTAMPPNDAVLTQSLQRDGKPVAALPGSPVTRYNVPADNGRYRLDLHYAPGSDYRVDTSWEFTSAPGQDKAAPGFQCWNDSGMVPVEQNCQALPTISVDYDLDLSPANTVKGYGFTTVKFRPHHVGAITTPIKQVALSASYDGGKTWLRLLPLPSGGGWRVAFAPLPRPGATVSLRVQAGDRDGNTVTETITNAFHVTK
ncbi:S8 family peptidase [Labedaea rhizosphaerae]|nr:S8 family serine peptidase [Labedaea rhizosphaerae]